MKDTGAIRPGVMNPRVVVSVGISREEFERISNHAAACGMKISEFIRTAALTESAPKPVVTLYSVSGKVQWNVPPLAYTN